MKNFIAIIFFSFISHAAFSQDVEADADILKYKVPHIYSILAKDPIDSCDRNVLIHEVAALCKELNQLQSERYIPDSEYLKFEKFCNDKTLNIFKKKYYFSPATIAKASLTNKLRYRCITFLTRLDTLTDRGKIDIDTVGLTRAENIVALKDSLDKDTIFLGSVNKTQQNYIIPVLDKMITICNLHKAIYLEIAEMKYKQVLTAEELRKRILSKKTKIQKEYLQRELDRLQTGTH
jgi:hypothetical protein